MLDITNYEIFKIVNLIALFMGITFGAIAQKTQFCFSGSIKDYILLGSTKRAASVVMAMITALSATYILVLVYDINLGETVWRKENINYFTIILGGCLFGTGMMIADGCSSRHLIKFSQGDNTSLITLIFIAIFAYATTQGILSGIAYKLVSNKTLLDISSSIGNPKLNIIFILFILFILLFALTKKIKRILTLKDGMFIGLLITLGWYITGVYGGVTLELDTRYVNFTSITFVSPTANTLELITNYKNTNLDFGISLVFGVIIGSFTMSQFNKKYSFGCTSNIKVNKVKNSIIGGALMGIGGVLALGCTVGQGLSGFSTLASSSVVAILSIMISGYLTALYLNRKNQLPMCFIFEWDDEKK